MASASRHVCVRQREASTGWYGSVTLESRILGRLAESSESGAVGSSGDSGSPGDRRDSREAGFADSPRPARDGWMSFSDLRLRADLHRISFSRTSAMFTFASTHVPQRSVCPENLVMKDA